MVISFLRVEGLLEGLWSARSWRSSSASRPSAGYVHVPADRRWPCDRAFTRTLGFIWLALLVVVAELLIVISRFIFSYEQAFMADLVRFWYAALFLFASAYTLLEEATSGSTCSMPASAADAAAGSMRWARCCSGMTLCWAILLLGMWTKSSIINSPILSFEVTQSGFRHVRQIPDGRVSRWSSGLHDASSS